MYDIIIFVLIMILTGAWTGYITNDVAIKMLFKEYGFKKFKFGGVIVKTRKDLEKNLAQLVEKEIINHNTLKSQFHKKELKEAISKTVVMFFNDAIFKHSENMNIKDLPGFNHTIDNLSEFLRTFLENNLSQTFLDFSQRIELNDVISSEQAYNLSVSITKELIRMIDDKQIIVHLVEELYQNYHELSLEDVIGEEIKNTIINNLNELLNNIFDEMRYKNDKDIQTLISKLYRDIDFDSFVETIESHIGNKKLSYFLSENSLEKLYDLFSSYLNNPNSNESIEVFCEGLLIALKKIDKPIIELFTGDLRVEVEKFLENQLPGIIDKLIEIVKRNSHEIEELIESSIDQTIYDQQTIKRIILGAIRMFLIENFTQKYDIINKIVEMLKGIDIEDLSITVSEQVVDLLHQKSISSIICELELNNILTAKLISSQVHRILKFLTERYLSKDIEHADFLNKTIQDMIHLNIKPFVNHFTVSLLTKQIIYNEDVLKFIKNQISLSLQDITKLPINHFIHESKIKEYGAQFQSSVVKQLNRNYSDILDLVYKNMDHFFQQNNLGDLLNKNENMVFKSEAVIDIIIKSLKNLIEDNKSFKVHDLFASISSIDNLSENVVNAIMEFLDNGLSSILEGNIAKVVEDNIKSLSNDEVLVMMQEFMGTKLKPLTIVGAYLGGFVGLLLGIYFIYSGNTDLLTFLHLKELFISIGIYALLGYLTNVIAIFFIFKPYKPLFGVKSLQGIIPKQIPILAKAMGNVVANNLLSENSIDQMVHNNEEKLKTAFVSNVQKEDYKVLKTYLGEHSSDISKQITLYINRYLRENNGLLASKFTEETMKFDLHKIQTHSLTETFSKIFVERLNESNAEITNFLVNRLKSSKTIQELSADLNINTVETKIQGIIDREILKFISLFNNPNYLVQLVKNNSDKINLLIEKDLNTVLPDATKLGFENFLYNLVSTYLFSRDKQKSLSNYVINEITMILHNNDSIDELFGGRFIELVNFNMSTILERIEDTVKTWLMSHRDEINDSVTHRVYDELTVVQQVGYKAINGDKLIRETVHRIIEEKLPEFISRKMDNLNNEFNNFFENMGKIRLKDAKLELKREELYKYFSDVFESKEIEIKTRRFIHVVMSYFYEFKTTQLFDVLDIKTTADITHKYNDLFLLVNNGVYQALNLRKDKIVFDVSFIINKFITKEIMSNRIRNLTLGINQVEVDKLVRNIQLLLNKNNFLQKNTEDLVGLVFEHFKTIPMQDLIDELFLKQDMKKLIRKLTADQEFEKTIYRSLFSLFTIVIEDFNIIVTDELKNKILVDIINATYEVIAQNLFELLEAVDFREVTVREINGMEPKQIKELFDSFGSRYFRKLEGYGIFGGVFAVSPITLLTMISYSINYLKSKD